MKAILSAMILAAAFAAASPARALEAFACEPDWASLLEELGAGHVETYTAINAHQDPHYIQARPSLIAHVRNADLLVCSGAQLEIGWLPLLLRRSTNSKVQPGQPGYFLAADQVRKIEVPSQIDRAQGDIHPEGNPHVQLDPRNIKFIARALSQRLKQIDAANAADYDSALSDFQQRWDEASEKWEQRARTLRGLRVVAHHVSFSYLLRWLHMDYAGTLEPKPGVPPTSSHLSELLSDLKANPPAAIIRAPYQDPKPSEWLSERLGVPAIVLPYTVGGAEGADDLFGLYDVTLDRLEEVAK